MPTLSILTPTWNRAEYLPRVHGALEAQTCRDFEWIVADDGSTDGTTDTVRRLAAASAFPILLLTAQAHVGKARMDNEAIRHARGELLLWCDSDDILTPEAVATFLSTWRGLSSDQRQEFVGVTALAATKAGVLANPFPGSEYRDVSWNDLAGLHRVTADMTFLVRTDVMRSNPFPEVDLVVPESVVWNVIGDGKTRFIPKVLRLVEYRAPNAISFSGKMNYNRGRAYAAAVMQRRLRSYSSERYERMRRLVNFLRYCIHGEIGMAEARRLWADNSPSPSFWSCVPVAHLLALADRLRNKVVRSHREFLANQGSPVSATWLGTEVAPQ